MADIKKVLLHIGCGNDYQEGFINSDRITHHRGRNYKLDLVMDISKPWPYENESIDGIVSMRMLPQLTWHELIPAFREAYRVLKKGGVMRIGCVVIENKKLSLDYLLGWGDVNLFSLDLLKMVLVDRVGFSLFKEQKFRQCSLPEFVKVDNHRREVRYFEVIK